MTPFRNKELDAHAARVAALEARSLAEQSTDPAERERHYQRAAWWEERARMYEDDFDLWEDETDGEP